MRSSKQSDLDDVRARFAAWRRGPRRGPIPDSLWRAALELLDRHGTSTICRRLALNPSRFKQMRETFGRHVSDDRGKARRKGGSRALRGCSPRGLRRSVTKGDRAAAGSSGQVFIELAPPGFRNRPLSLAPPDLQDTEHPAGACRLVVESAGGARLTIILIRAEGAVIDAVCRSVLAAPGHAAL